MALVRCKAHEPEGQNKPYVASAEPVGYPTTALVCGNKNCEEPGLVWLVQDELDAYESGERVFQIASFATKLRVK